MLRDAGGIVLTTTGGSEGASSITLAPAAVPLPPALLLFAFGLAAVAFGARAARS
jgi:hypothetical protein